MRGILSPVPYSVLGLDPGVVWPLALAAALAYAMYFAKRSGLDYRVMYWAGVSALLGGIWGAHLLELLASGSVVEPIEWVRFWTGPKSYFGGLAGGAILGALFLRMRRKPLLAYADAVVPAVSLGYAIGRIGCFLNGDDYGTVSNVAWAVQYPPGTEAQAAHLARGLISSPDSLSLPVHPVQLYSSLIGLCLLVSLSRMRPATTGGRACIFAMAYGIARFAVEFLRGDADPVLGPLSLPQVCSALLVIFGLCLWLRLRKRHSSLIWLKPINGTRGTEDIGGSVAPS